MKILLLSPLPPPEGGIATWTKKYKKFCEENNISLSIVNTGLIGKRLKKINASRNYFDEVKRTICILKDLKAQLKAYGPDIIHINSSCSYFGIMRDALCVRVIKKFELPMVFHCRCNIQDQIRTDIAKSVFKYIVKNVDNVLTLNTASFNYVTKTVQNKAIMIPNFIDLGSINEQYHVREKIKKVLFVGHVQKTKGFHEIINAAKRLSDLEFVLIGPVQKEAQNELCSENVKVLGAKSNSDVKEYLKEADVFLFPSYTEGFSNALVEAMAAGLPIVTTDVGANLDMIEEHGGIIVPVGDYQSIVDAINEMRDFSVRHRMSVWNREKVQREYLIDSVMYKLLSVYKQACASKDD